MSRLAHQTIDFLRSGLARRSFSSLDIVEDVLASIAERDSQIGAYVHIDAEDARVQARAADAAISAGKDGDLLGIPIAVKDVLNVEGQPCTCSSKILDGYTSPYDATAIARLRDAGAILLGRTNMDEFAMGSSTENSALQTTRNPWNTDCVPGGSSGGSGAAVGGGLAVAALGTDTGGSIRQPASFCGCVGLKPTYGRVSRYGLTAYASSLDQVGPMTRSVADAAAILRVLAGHDGRDSTSLNAPVPDYSEALGKDLRGMRLGLPREYFVEGTDPEVEASVRKAVEQCRALGAEIVDVDLPHSRYAIATYYIIATAEASANLARFDGVRYGRRVDGADTIEMMENTRGEGFGPEVKRRIILGTYVLSSGYYDAYYRRAQKVRTLICRDFAQAFEHCDALLSPTAPTAAFPLGAKIDDPLKMYLNDIFTVTANLAGICGLSVPCGKTSTGLPIGLQILGPALGESAILRVGDAYERARGEFGVAP